MIRPKPRYTLFPYTTLFRSVNRSVATGMQLVIHTGLVNRVQQQKDDSPTDQEEAEPSLHRESASRTCRKFRSLFNSASSRKPSCSFCQAATPSRVACSAPFGT